MPKITFLADHVEIEVPVGTSIQTAVEQAKATLPFGCRMGSCGTCRVHVEEGMKNLNPMTQQEHDLFETLTAVERTERLACQLIVIKKGNVKIRS